jgi:hypothetical protein
MEIDLSAERVSDRDRELAISRIAMLAGSDHEVTIGMRGWRGVEVSSVKVPELEAALPKARASKLVEERV